MPRSDDNPEQGHTPFCCWPDKVIVCPAVKSLIVTVDIFTERVIEILCEYSARASLGYVGYKLT